MQLKNEIDQYCQDIISGKIESCKWVRLSVERYLKDLETAKDRGLYFDELAGEHIIIFFEEFLRHSKGEWAGNKFILETWQKFILWNIFGWKRENGLRRFRTVYIEIPRKNGKTTLAAGIGLYLFVADNEPGAEIYSVATKRDQAIITHSEAVRMIKLSSELKKIVSIFKNNLNIEKTASKFEPLASDSDTLDGLNIHGAIIDELHAHKSANVWDVIDTATGSRRQPMKIAITTAGFDKNSICWEQHEYIEKILQNIIEDDSYFGIIYTIDDPEQWDNEKLWGIANPNLNVCVKLDDMKELCARAKEIPSRQNAFMRKRLNLWTQAETRWISAEKWKECQDGKYIEKLRGNICYGGLDLASVADTASFSLVFPPIEEDDPYRIIIKFWIPEEKMKERSRKGQLFWENWVKQKHINITPGNVIDYGFILKEIDKLAIEYDIKEIAFDRWGATKIVQELQNKGMEVIEFGQGFASMSPPSKEFEKLILSKKVAHDGNPVLNWMINNVVIRMDSAENIKPDKEKSTEKIDGVVATIMALDRALRNIKKRSVYEDRGIL